MNRVLPFLLVLFLPLAAFAQAPHAAATSMLKQLGLNDGQVGQVLDIQGKTATAVRADVVQIRLLQAQLQKALLLATPDMNGVNAIIAQIGQTRVDMQKILVAASVQLRQIMGDDAYRVYRMRIRQRFGAMGRRAWGSGPGGWMNGAPMGGGRGMMGGPGSTLGG